MTLKYSYRLAAVALLAAWAFDLLFWKQTPGISFALFCALVLGAGMALAFGEGIRPSMKSLALLIPLSFFAAMTFLRQEPFTRFVSGVLSLALMACFAITFRNGLWLRYSLPDWIVALLRFAASLLAGGFQTLAARNPAGPPGEAGDQVQKPSTLRAAAGPLALGLLLALPALLVFGGLLSAADPAFARILNDFLRIFAVENLAEYLFRAVYILVLAYLLAGVYRHAFLKSSDAGMIGLEKPWLSPFLGWIEAAVILGCVDALFGLFVGVQFRYFFGGQSNITVEGFTYASYAQRGFNEMFSVVVLSLALFLGLGAITRRPGKTPRRVFSALGIILVALVGVILVSAFQRLLLYEQAYGFTRIRTYTHVLMLWTGVLLAATAVLELTRRPRGFAAALLLTVIGFGMTLSLLNVDAFIARQNLARAAQGEALDADYLATLSEDAVPVLALSFQQTSNPAIRNALGAALTCAQLRIEENPAPGWRAYNASREQARRALAGLEDKWTGFDLQKVDAYHSTITAGPLTVNCYAGD